MAAEKHNQVLFKVLRDATKPEIKAAVELMFKVEVDFGADRQCQKGKVKRFGKSIGRRDHVKKAYVSLKAGPGAQLRRGGRVMAVIKVKPTSPGRRGVVKVVHAHLHKGRPEASLLEPQMQNAGRNNNGHITIRHKGGGHKHHYRVVDFVRNKDGSSGQGRAHRVRPQPHGAHRAACATPTASAATSSRRAGSKSARR